MSRLSEKVPRGFTRFYVLYLLTEKAMTGKEIIEESSLRSEGDWAPSPGLIYPLLGRLVRDGLIAETNSGGYVITEAGENALNQYNKLQRQMDNQFYLINRLGISMYTTSKFVAEETINRLSALSSFAWDRVSRKSEEVQRRFEEKYEEFLLDELERLQQRKKDNSPKA
jgi:DNA-binding PadR family transcriptional regulator